MTEKIPQPLKKPDFSKLIAYLNEGLECVAENQSSPKDFDHYVFETAMEAVYGKDIWEWYNKVNQFG